MLGSYADMSFLDFFWYQGKPGIFFAVELGAIVSAIILAWLFRREKAPIEKSNERTVVTDYVPTVLLLLCFAFDNGILHRKQARYYERTDMCRLSRGRADIYLDKNRKAFVGGSTAPNDRF